MNMKLLSTFIIGTVLLIAPGAVDAQTTTKLNKDDINFIRETAENICGDYAHSGKVFEAGAKAGLEVSISNVFKKIGVLSGDVSADVKITEWSGILQNELASFNTKNSNCRIRIFESLLSLIKSGKTPDRTSYALPDRRTNMPANSCGNGVQYYESIESIGTLHPQSTWTCKGIDERRISIDRKGLTVSERLLVDQYRGISTITWGGSTIRWAGSQQPFFTIKVRNDGPSTIYVSSVELLGRGDKISDIRPNFFSKAFILHPADELFVPVGDLESVAKFADANFDPQQYTYTASIASNEACAPLSDAITSAYCEGFDIGFGLSLVYKDIFGDEYRRNTVAFVHKQRWSLQPDRTETLN